ncbi:hypothetical protein HOD75_00540 [archaeon]|mgnify:CR=1 FL=1|jgi:hypothetical protein|nr:hypothetical protein [archaeon]MBT4241363.1 hypothetical protein [archaeon]MBT4418184.1 hypothetical protein [archaeon]
MKNQKLLDRIMSSKLGCLATIALGSAPIIISPLIYQDHPIESVLAGITTSAVLTTGLSKYSGKVNARRINQNYN